MIMGYGQRTFSHDSRANMQELGKPQIHLKSLGILKSERELNEIFVFNFLLWFFPSAKTCCLQRLVCDGVKAAQLLMC